MTSVTPDPAVSCGVDGDDLVRDLGAIFLVAIAAQALNVRLFGLFGQLAHSWTGSVLILLATAACLGRYLAHRPPSAGTGLASPWKWWAPWVIVGLLLAQVAGYPPTMHDSLSYRLPRMFFALQSGSFAGFSAGDARMIAMPIGWESLALPFATFHLIGAAALISVVGWMVIYHLCARMVAADGVPESRARLVALSFASAPFLLLQGSSTANDIYAAALLLIGTWFAWDFRRRPGPAPVLMSLLALVLAASAKPQFLVLGAAWIAWWAFCAGAPWKHVSWWLLAAVSPLYYAVSPLPELVANLVRDGSLVGGTAALQIDDAPPAWRMAGAGVVQFGVSQLQLPLVPAADAVNRFIAGLPGVSALGRGIPNFRPGVGLVAQIDQAGFGLVHGLLLGTGVIAGLRKPLGGRWRVVWLAAVAGCFLVACSQVVGATMGRSFAGFFFVLLPLAATGWARIANHRAFVFACGLALAAGALTLVLNPSAPLWPARTISGAVGHEAVKTKIDRYLSYQDRARTGAGMLDPVPRGESVGLLIRGVTPVLALWQPDWRDRRLYYVHEIPAETFAAGETDWLVIAERAEELQPEAHGAYQRLVTDWEEVHAMNYFPTLAQGKDTWRLFRRLPDQSSESRSKTDPRSD